MKTFTDALNEYLSLREAVQVKHGPLWEELQRAADELNHMVHHQGAYALNPQQARPQGTRRST